MLRKSTHLFHKARPDPPPCILNGKAKMFFPIVPLKGLNYDGRTTRSYFYKGYPTFLSLEFLNTMFIKLFLLKLKLIADDLPFDSKFRIEADYEYV